MPRKRKSIGETGATETEPEAISEGASPKTSPRRLTAKSLPRKVTESAKKPPSRQTTAAASQPQPAETQIANTAVQPTPVAASLPESAAAAPESAEAILSSAVSIQEQIALLAYSYWEARGRRHANAEEDWYRAEREILSRLSSAAPKS